jgi:hypothetical protein
MRFDTYPGYLAMDANVRNALYTSDRRVPARTGRTGRNSKELVETVILPVCAFQYLIRPPIAKLKRQKRVIHQRLPSSCPIQTNRTEFERAHPDGRFAGMYAPMRHTTANRQP